MYFCFSVLFLISLVCTVLFNCLQVLQSYLNILLFLLLPFPSKSCRLTQMEIPLEQFTQCFLTFLLFSFFRNLQDNHLYSFLLIFFSCVLEFFIPDHLASPLHIRLEDYSCQSREVVSLVLFEFNRADKFQK